MARQLKRWESPRKEGRNTKGRGGSARKRQRQKQLKLLAQKLKQQPDVTQLTKNQSIDRSDHYRQDNHKQDIDQQGGSRQVFSPLFFYGGVYGSDRLANVA
ncbi:MAG: hypothetical protein HC769_05760 [Cyanobacteria bacterium CRU_2_1]|nr:hypothetical protein [Cyanobacteria bacterium RU_5_0]NJR58397.1 hypothetical protein [Cyanobacteria bacterium CRU_2_1]